MFNRRFAVTGFAAALLLGTLMSSHSRAEDPKPTPIAADLVAELKHGGFNIFFRHGITPNYKDPLSDDQDNPRHTDCSYQRNLSDEGIAQARAIGLAFRELEFPVGIVRASPMCRSMDTAWYAFGRYERDFALKLNGTNPENDPPEAKIWKHMRNIAKILPMPGTNSIFLSHGTAGEVFGAGYLDEGEAVLVKPDGAGNWKLIARVKSDQWRAQ